MTPHHPIAEAILLSIVVLACWLGPLGMVRMKEPTQALHYLSLPALAALVLTAAVFVETGSSSAAWKMLFISFMLLAVNSVVTHATARAFRARELGHWQPRAGDPIEFVRDAREPKEQE